MVYGETGEILLSLCVKCRIVKYWSRLITCQKKKLSSCIYKFIYTLHTNNIYHSPRYYVLRKYYVILISRGSGKANYSHSRYDCAAYLIYCARPSHTDCHEIETNISSAYEN